MPSAVENAGTPSTPPSDQTLQIAGRWRTDTSKSKECSRDDVTMALECRGYAEELYFCRIRQAAGVLLQLVN